MSYVELHCHSAFSLLDGASDPEALVARAQQLGYPAIALTDKHDLGGAVRFAYAARELGIEGIIGAEIALQLGARSSELGGTANTKLSELRAPSSDLVLLAQSREGYGNISSLITRGRMDNDRGSPSISLDTLARHSAGVFALTGSPNGWVPQLIAEGDADKACEAAATLLDIFEGRLAIEVWDHHLPEERELVKHLIPIARSLGIPWVVTNDVRYVFPTGRAVHDVLACLKHQKTLDEMGTRLLPNGEWYLKSFDQLRRRWQHDETGLKNTLRIAERCTFRLGDLKPDLPTFPLPPGVSDDEYLARLVDRGAIERWGQHLDELDPKYRKQLEHELALIKKLKLAGFFLIVWDIVRFANREGVLCQGRGSAANSAICYVLGITAIDPIKMELLFERFLSEGRPEAPDIDLDFAHRDREKVLQYVYERYGREHAAMVCEQITYRGRSAIRDAARVLGFSAEQAGALANLSDRFSAKATAEALRSGMTAHEMAGRYRDHDARWDEPNGALSGVAKPENVMAQPWTAEWLRAATDGKDLPQRTNTRPFLSSGKARRFEREEMDPHTRARPADIERAPQPSSKPETRNSPPKASKKDHEERRNPVTAIRPVPAESILGQVGLDPNDGRVRLIPAIVDGLHQLPRHRSIHVGGFVLTKEPLATVVPIEPASMPGRTVIQWERDDLDLAGLAKIDLLGLGMLTVLQDCLKYIRATRGVTVDLAKIDMDDQAVYDDLCRADTIGLFQVESRAQMQTLPRLKPRNFYDIVVEVAIIRPGPIQGDMVHPYLRRRAGEEEVTYPHPSLEPVLKRTLGVPLFQEQGMQVAITAASFTPGEADTLRRAMGHKRSHERMAAIREKLIAGMQRNGIPEDVAARIYNQINGFADYGFPESHAASFALIVYASAYLRHYYFAEYLCAMLNAQPMGFYSPGTLIEDGKRHGVVVRHVDLTSSSWDHTLEVDGVMRVVPNDGNIRVEEQGAGSKERGLFAPGSSLPAPRSSLHAPAVRIGLRQVRGLGPAAREVLEKALTDGPFKDIGDVVRRVKLDSATITALAQAGAFDTMVSDMPRARQRRTALWRVLEAMRGAAGPLAPVIPKATTPDLPPLKPVEIADADYRMTGLSLNGHPMKHLREVLKPNGIRTAKDLLRNGRDGEEVAHAGLVICRQRPGTAKGFVFLSMEDETGILNVIVTPQKFEKQALLISQTPLLLVRGTLQVQEKVVNLKARTFRALRASAGDDWAPTHDFH
ncbi:MAG TPA: PHP domain-containing protein [Gemmatimonadaceae bacterium]|nr:PHP domain-containing protein [Gemmatimonadaceae bacterium]